MQFISHIEFIIGECTRNFTTGGFLEEKEGELLIEGSETQRRTDRRKRRVGMGGGKTPVSKLC